MLFLIVSTLGIACLYGQDDYSQKGYFHFNIGAGSHKLLYNTLNEGKSEKMHYLADAYYSFFFQSHWGVQAGVGIQSFESRSELNDVFGFADVDANGDHYIFLDFIRQGNCSGNESGILF